MNKISSTFGEVSNWNFGDNAIGVVDYWEDFRKTKRDMNMPALFFYGKKDWMVGPKHYKGVKFPEMILWESDVGHMPFLENKADLEKAILKNIRKYKK